MQRTQLERRLNSESTYSKRIPAYGRRAPGPFGRCQLRRAHRRSGTSVTIAVAALKPGLKRTHFYVSNDYVLDLAKRSAKVLPGCSINPIRRDAREELERCRAAGCRLVKIHTAIQGVDPDRAEFDPFYALARKLGVVLMFHTGYEHSCTVLSQQFTDPRRLARPLNHGVPVIAAHCGTCGFFDREDYFPHFVSMMSHYENLYGDTAILASLIRWRSLRRLSQAPRCLQDRIIHGSDYPFPPARLPYVFRIGLRPAERGNPLDLDLAIKQTFRFGDRYACRILELLESKPTR